MIVITSFEQLKAVITENDGACEFAIALNGGAFSSKSIHHDGEGWDIFHSISDCWVEYPNDEAFQQEEDFILTAMEKGALYVRP